MGIGEPLIKIGVIEELNSEGQKDMRIRAALAMHHAIYEVETLLREFYGPGHAKVSDSELLPYQKFVEYLHHSNNGDAARFWQKYLADFRPRPFPTLPGPEYRPLATAVEEQTMAGIKWEDAEGITANTLLLTSWRLILSKHSGAIDIVFGAMLLGCQIPMTGIESVGGQSMAKVPIRLILDWEKQDVIKAVRPKMAKIAS
ncbi:hypothetical protein BJX63DRAFT_433993 [Aspergillus granulosus]|uniref:Condensation domain-containing protein n=1 Tax=Aspergillus granulosus TaxID=176169 RepID=A0ABR4H5K4_9EURO